MSGLLRSDPAKILLLGALGLALASACGGESAPAEPDPGGDVHTPEAATPDAETPDLPAPDADGTELGDVEEIMEIEELDAAGDLEEIHDAAEVDEVEISDGVADVADATDIGPDTPAVVVTFDPAQIPELSAGFPLSVQATDARPDSARLWTRYLGSEPLQVRVFADGAGTSPGELLLSLDAPAADGGYVQVDVDGLLSGTWHRYTFVTVDADGEPVARSPLGRFRSALAPDLLAPVVFGGISCIDEGLNPFTVLARAGEDDLDFFLMAGDAVYADGSDNLEDYRGVWSDWFDHPEYQKLHEGTSLIYTWDDHEIDNNWDPETFPADQRAAGEQAFHEHAAIRPQPDGETRIWRTFRWGRTVEVFVLDTRGERKPSTRKTDDAIYISKAQMAWLKEGLMASEAVFKIIVNSVPYTNMPPIYLSQDDRWEGYASQREELRDVLDGLEGVMLVSGDFHFPAIAGIEPPGSPLDLTREVFMGPGAQVPNPLWLLMNNAIWGAQFAYISGNNNYVRFLAQPEADPPTITVDFIAADGSVLHSEDVWF